jgi:RHS repeat-associated protein
LGNRIAKTVGGQTTYFLYDTARQLVAEADEDGNLTSQYLYADLLPVAVLRGHGGGQTRELFAIHADHRGLPLAVTDHEGVVVWKGDFDPFGNSRATAPPTVGADETRSGWISAAHAAPPRSFVMNLRMAGQYADGETGLYYNVHRFYDPVKGRYITPDPLGLAGGGHAYEYAGANPLGRVDPLGLFEVPTAALLGNDSIFVERELPLSDGGHGDILRIAFAQLAMKAGGPRFSPEIIDQIVINNYHTDANGYPCLTYIPNGSIKGGGQCNEKNHFDNPNEGPMYSTMPDPTNPQKVMTKLPGYTDNRGDNWILDSINQVKANRLNYGTVEQNPYLVFADISLTLNAFGQNSHALADFYSHTNWTDSSAYTTSVVDKQTVYTYTRGGKGSYSYTEPLTGRKEKICGWVPTGLDMTTIWDEESNIDKIFSGSAHGIVETLTSGAVYTHSYWNKDSEGKTGGKQKYLNDQGKVDDVLLASFVRNGMSFWSVQAFDPNNPPTKRDPRLVAGIDWFGDGGKSKNFTEGERIYVRKPIKDRHEMAFYLAIEHTKTEIIRLYDAAAGKKLVTGGPVGPIQTFSLQDVFKMSKDDLNKNHIMYDRLFDKSRGAVTP